MCVPSTIAGSVRIVEDIWGSLFLGELLAVCEIMVWVFVRLLQDKVTPDELGAILLVYVS